jgi:hypothetical protein
LPVRTLITLVRRPTYAILLEQRQKILDPYGPMVTEKITRAQNHEIHKPVLKHVADVCPNNSINRQYCQAKNRQKYCNCACIPVEIVVGDNT